MSTDLREQELREYICKQYTKPYREMRSDLQHKVDEMVNLALPFATGLYKLTDAELGRIIHEDELFIPWNGHTPEIFKENIEKSKRNKLRRQLRVALHLRGA